MQIRNLLNVLVALAIIVLPISAAAHEGHNQDLSDEEMLMMEAVEASQSTQHVAGAKEHMPLQTTVAASPAMSPQEMMQQKVEENRLKSAGDLMSRLHPVAAHFPIALLMFAAFAEIVLIFRPNAGLQITIRFMLAGGAAGAVVTTLFGWFAGGWRLADRSETLAIHRWNGTAVALLSILAWWLAARTESRLGIRIVLAIIFAALVVQGYYGGEMVHGPNHMGVM